MVIVVLTVASLVASGVPGTPAQAISRADVDQACAESQQAYDTYRSARSDFEEAARTLETANQELADAEYREQRIRGIYQDRQDATSELEAEVEAQAAEIYMQSVGGAPGAFVAFSSPEDVLVTFELLRSSTDQNMQSVNDLTAASSELDRLGGDLEAAVVDLTTVRDSQQELTTQQESAMTAALDSYDQLSDDCKQLQAEYEAEQARLRAEEEARKQREAAARERANSGGSNSGSSGKTVSGIICPFTPGRTQFTNSWGAPRSGGRSHKGADMFALWDEPVYAVASGSVVTGNYGLGGKIIWLKSDSGAAFYYAHLNGFAVPPISERGGPRLQTREILQSHPCRQSAPAEMATDPLRGHERL